MIIKSNKTTEEKINIYRALFLSRLDAYGTYDIVSKKFYQIKKTVDNNVLINHLTGKQPYGVYLLNKKITKAIVVDFDDQNKSNPVNFVSRAKHYGIPSYIEVSKSKGFHVWMFCFGNGISAVKARTVTFEILEDIDCGHTEVFPKQNSTENGTKYGNFINAPLFGNLVFKNKTVFVDPITFKPYQDQWSFLERVELITEENLTNLIEMNEWQLIDYKLNKKNTNNSDRLKRSSGLLPCAKEMLAGVLTNQRVICFRLAIHLKSIGVSEQETIKILKIWAQKNTPIEDKRIITGEEIISQIKYFFGTV